MVSTSGLSDWLYVKHRRIRSCECSGTMEKEKNQTSSQMTETILEWKRHGDLALTTVRLNVFICGEVRSHFCQTNQHQQILRASWGQNEHAKLNKAVNCRSHQCKYSILHWWDTCDGYATIYTMWKKWKQTFASFDTAGFEGNSTLRALIIVSSRSILSWVWSWPKGRLPKSIW